MSTEINHDRRRFLAAAAMTSAAVQLGIAGRANAESARVVRFPQRVDFPR
jgi:hypothetical protein